MIHMRKSRTLSGIFIRALEVLSFLILLFVILVNIFMVWASRDKTLDFGSFAAAGVNLKNGKDPYDVRSPLIFEIHFRSLEAGGRLPNLNPPITLPFFSILSEENVHEAANIWRLISAGCYVATVLLLAQKYQISPLQLVWSFSLAGFWHTIELGQIYVPLLVLASLFLVYSDKNRPILSGISLGLLISIKPNFLVWLIFIFLQRKWKTALVTVMTAIAVALIPFFFYGHSVYFQWLEVIEVNRQILAMPGNSSIPGLFARLGHLQFAWPVTAALLLTVVLLALRTPRHVTHKPRGGLDETGLIVSLLISPISWAGYTMLLLPLFLTEKHWTWNQIAAAAILAIPFLFILNLFEVSNGYAIFWGSIYMLPLILCLIENLRSLTLGYRLTDIPASEAPDHQK